MRYCFLFLSIVISLDTDQNGPSNFLTKVISFYLISGEICTCLGGEQKEKKNWTSNSSWVKYLVRISQMTQVKVWFHFCMSQQPEPEWKTEFNLSIWNSTLLQIPALHPSTLLDIYYRAEGEIFFFVNFIPSSLLFDNSNLTLLKSIDYFLCTQNIVWTSFPWAVLTSSGDIG